MELSGELTLEEKGWIADLLVEFQDVFARGEFDFGVLEHEIDTGDARPVKERMRRTPLFFMDEEEAHLKKMLDTGVIQPSVSEWASTPVLIRKTDRCVGAWIIGSSMMSSERMFSLCPLLTSVWTR